MIEITQYDIHHSTELSCRDLLLRDLADWLFLCSNFASFIVAWCEFRLWLASFKLTWSVIARFNIFILSPFSRRNCVVLWRMLCNLVWRFSIIRDFHNVGLIIGIILNDMPHTSSRWLIFCLWLHLYCIFCWLRSWLIIFLEHSGGLGWRSIYNIYITCYQGTILL